MKKNFVILEISILSFVKAKTNSRKTKKTLVWGQNTYYLDTFRLEFGQIYCQIFQNAKFCVKVKIFKFWTKYALFGFFGKQFLKTIVIFEISALGICLIRKFGAKIKILKFGIKEISYLSIFGLEFDNNIVIFEVSTIWLALLKVWVPTGFSL